MRHEKFLYPELPEKERFKLIRDNCEAVKPNANVTRALTDNEIQARRETLAEQAIEMGALTDELAKFKEKINAELKPLQKKYVTTLQEIKTRQTTLVEDVYLFYDLETEQALEYSRLGELLNRRQMNEEERQHNIMQVVRENRAINE